MRYLEGCGHTVPTSLGSYKAAVPLPPSPLNSNFSGASGLILRRRARAELEAQGARTHPRCSPSHLQAHTHSGDGGRVPGPGIHLGGEAPGSENGSPPLPSPLLRPEPTPIRRPPRAPASAPRVERSRESWTRTPLARTADRRFPTPQLPQGHPRCKEMPQTHFSPCGPNSSPPPTSLQRRAAGLTVGSYHTRSQPRGWHLGGDLVLLCPRGPRPQASVLPPSPRLDEMGARGRQPQPSPGAHARPRDGIPARAWLGQGTHRWTQA